jgi:RNA polymerase sigma-70 factor (ECF subfamily)
MTAPLWLSAFSDDDHVAHDMDSSERGSQDTRASTDVALAERVRDGDAVALGHLHEVYWSSLTRYAYRIVGSIDGARDIVQDVFADVWIRRSSFIPHGTVAAYLYRAVRNRALAVVRDRDTAERLQQRLVWQERHDENDTTLEIDELNRVVHVALDAIAPRAREAYLLRAEQGLGIAEIAMVMGITEGTTRLQLSRAMAAVRDGVRRYLAEADRRDD